MAKVAIKNYMEKTDYFGGIQTNRVGGKRSSFLPARFITYYNEKKGLCLF